MEEKLEEKKRKAWKEISKNPDVLSVIELLAGKGAETISDILLSDIEKTSLPKLLVRGRIAEEDRFLMLRTYRKWLATKDPILEANLRGNIGISKSIDGIATTQLIQARQPRAPTPPAGISILTTPQTAPPQQPIPETPKEEKERKWRFRFKEKT